jgi:hypothetical protein
MLPLWWAAPNPALWLEQCEPERNFVQLAERLKEYERCLLFLPLLAPRYAGNVVVRQQHSFVHIALIYATLRSSDSSFAR